VIKEKGVMKGKIARFRVSRRYCSLLHIWYGWVIA